jgi:hypothetical protein
MSAKDTRICLRKLDDGTYRAYLMKPNPKIFGSDFLMELSNADNEIDACIMAKHALETFAFRFANLVHQERPCSNIAQMIVNTGTTLNPDWVYQCDNQDDFVDDNRLDDDLL